jgi:glycerophosphoryl diester phosphodiesterase
MKTNINKIPIYPTIILLLTIVPILFNCASSNYKTSDLTKIDLQGHRGARGLKPENTWPAFQAAIEYKMTTLELDTVLTKDGKVIIHHDSDTNPVICQNLDGTPIEKQSLYNLTLAELKELDCGSKKNPNFPEQVPVPGTKLLTIEEFFGLVADEEKKNSGKSPKFLYNIETKFPDDSSSNVSQERMKEHVVALIKAIEKYKTNDRVTIQSFYLPALLVADSINPKIKKSALFAPSKFQGLMMILGFGDSYRTNILEQAKASKANIVSPYFLYVTPGFVKNSHNQNLLVVPWTVNDVKEMNRLTNCGVDGIISDYPNRLREFVDLKIKSQN